MMYWLTGITVKYLDFKGRAARTEYWMFHLFNSLFWMSFVGMIYLLDYMIGIRLGQQVTFYVYIFRMVYPFVQLFIIIPIIALTVRRLHDIGYSGWLASLILVPVVNILFAVIIGLVKGDVGNKQ